MHLWSRNEIGESWDHICQEPNSFTVGSLHYVNQRQVETAEIHLASALLIILIQTHGMFLKLWFRQMVTSIERDGTLKERSMRDKWEVRWQKVWGGQQGQKNKLIKIKSERKGST